jgi:hypothetical protein
VFFTAIGRAVKKLKTKYQYYFNLNFMNKPTNKLQILLLSTFFVAGAFLMSACDDNEDPASIRPKVEIPTDFSNLTDEQNKENLEDNGIELVNAMTAMKNTAGVKSAISFTHFLGEAEIPQNSRNAIGANKVISMMHLISRFGLGTADGSEVLKSLRKKEDEPQTAQELFDNYAGTYAYNSTTDEWDYTKGTDKIEFKFPSTETGTANNATFAIYGYTSVQVSNAEAEYEGDLPTTLKADLTVSGTKQIEYDFTAAYKPNGEPTAAATSLTIGVFKLSFDMVNTTAEVAVNYSLTQNGDNLLSLGAGASGNFTTEGTEEAGDVVNSASAYFQIVDIRFAGKVDAAALSEAFGAINYDVDGYSEDEAAAYNAHTEFVVFYAQDNTKIADLEFYSSERTDSYSYCYYDFDLAQNVCETFEETSEAVDVRLKFKDGSPVDLETYTNEGFATLDAELRELIESLENDLE